LLPRRREAARAGELVTVRIESANHHSLIARRIDVEPATCSDPQCEADHGFTGALVGDDLTVRMAAAADGPDRVGRLVRFASSLQRSAAV